MSRQMQQAMDCNDAPPAAFAPVGASSTSEVNLWTLIPTWSGIAANDMRPGKVYELFWGGVLTTDATTAPDVIFTARIGTSSTPASNILLGSSTNRKTIVSLTVPCSAYLKVVVFSISDAAAGAQCYGSGWSLRGGSPGSASTNAVFGGLATSVDQTIAQGLMISITFDSSSASNTMTTQWVAMRSWN
jgi:hypothetical protein